MDLAPHVVRVLTRDAIVIIRVFYFDDWSDDIERSCRVHVISNGFQVLSLVLAQQEIVRVTRITRVHMQECVVEQSVDFVVRILHSMLRLKSTSMNASRCRGLIF